MSFSTDVKNELCLKENKARHCNISEIAGIINNSWNISDKHITIATENLNVAKHFQALLKTTFGGNPKILLNRASQVKHTKSFVVSTKDSGIDESAVMSLLSSNAYSNTPFNHLEREKKINALVLKSECCKRTYLRGTFLSSGSISDPEKHYHTEFVCQNGEVARGLLEILHFFELNAKMIQRKSNFVVYLKEGENIVDLLNIMGAHNCLLNVENVRVFKDMRNSVNRRVNFETANLDKTAVAALKQRMDIELILNQSARILDTPLFEVSEKRLKFPEASLKEIGEMLEPPIGKSGVNHRLRKISQMADEIRKKQEKA